MPRYREHTTNESGEPTGLVCSNCGCQHFILSWSDHLPNQVIKRVRHCRNCGRRKVTIERPAATDESR